MKYINLTQGYKAMVDDEDYKKVVKYKWFVQITGNCKHARTYNAGKPFFMHRILIEVPQGLFVDHINGNGLDNRKINLRVATHSQNMMNRKTHKNNTSGFKGVSWIKRTQKWQAMISTKHLGEFKSKTEAVNTYNAAAKKYYKDFAKLNEL